MTSLWRHNDLPGSNQRAAVKSPTTTDDDSDRDENGCSPHGIACESLKNTEFSYKCLKIQTFHVDVPNTKFSCKCVKIQIYYANVRQKLSCSFCHDINSCSFCQTYGLHEALKTATASANMCIWCQRLLQLISMAIVRFISYFVAKSKLKMRIKYFISKILLGWEIPPYYVQWIWGIKWYWFDDEQTANGGQLHQTCVIRAFSHHGFTYGFFSYWVSRHDLIQTCFIINLLSEYILIENLSARVDHLTWESHLYT